MNFPTRQQTTLDLYFSKGCFPYNGICFDPVSSCADCLILSHFNFAPSTQITTNNSRPDFRKTTNWFKHLFSHYLKKCFRLLLSTISYIAYSRTYARCLNPNTTDIYLSANCFRKVSKIRAVVFRSHNIYCFIRMCSIYNHQKTSCM